MHCQYCPITLDDSANNPFSSFEEYWINHCQAKIVQSERLETRKGSQHRYCTSNYNVGIINAQVHISQTNYRVYSSSLIVTIWPTFI